MAKNLIASDNKSESVFGGSTNAEDMGREASEAGRALGRLGASKGGKARAEKLTPDQRREIAQRAIEARWAKVRAQQPSPDGVIPQEICSGVLSIAGIDLPCAVVENQSSPDHPIRLFSQEGFLQALGRAGKAKGGQGASVVDGPPPFLAAKNLIPFIPNHLTGSTVPIVYKPQKAGRAFGFRAELLPEVCWVYIDAMKAGVLNRYPNQVRVAENCELLVRGMAAVGIVALVDEATGYQERRAKDELQQIINAYIRPEWKRYESKFPEEFFRQVYRLHGWPYKPGNAKRTPFLGHIINKYIYGTFHPAIYDNLRARNPKGPGGRRRQKHYYWLTEEVGLPNLEQRIAVVTMFMRSASDKSDFVEHFERAYATEYQERLPLVIDVTPKDELPSPEPTG